MRKIIGLLMLIFWCLGYSGHASAAGLSLVTSERLIDQLGKLHPMVLHFPIVLMTLAPVVMLISSFKFGRIWLPTIPWFIHLGTVSALGTVALGFAATRALGDLSPMLTWHRNLTCFSSLLMTLVSLYLLIRKPDLTQRVPRVLLAINLLVVLALTVGAHLGAETVHGKTFILFDAPERADDYR